MYLNISLAALDKHKYYIISNWYNYNKMMQARLLPSKRTRICRICKWILVSMALLSLVQSVRSSELMQYVKDKDDSADIKLVHASASLQPEVVSKIKNV